MSSAILDGRMLIGGHRVDAVSGEWFETLDPATGRQLALIARGGGRDVDAAVDSAREAFDRVWSRTAPLKRVQALNRVEYLPHPEVVYDAISELVFGDKQAQAERFSMIKAQRAARGKKLVP